MTTLSEADPEAHHVSTMPEGPPPEPLTPASTSTSTAASAPAPLPHDAAPLPTSSQDSTVSDPQRPEALNISTSNGSASTNNPLDANDDSTPPTSAISSHTDSQETADSLEPPEAKLQHVVEILKTEAAREQRSSSTSQSPEPTSLSGIKRTATGQMKRSSVNGLADVIANGSGHTRTLSAMSNGSSGNGHVLEVSQQLRTKLKYAMIKVQNGWQGRTFDEVESLASQSPRSTISGFQHFNDPQSIVSPRTVMARKYHRESSESDSSDSTVALENRGLINTMASPQVPSRRALAPPLDIMPGSRRRPTPNAPYHSGNGPNTQTRHLHSSRPSTSQRTPSQNAAMEADAVETLLFMASPNNSGYNPPHRASQESTSRSAQNFASQTSPLRTQFSQTSMASPKRVAFSEQGLSTAAVEKAALIDRMLDELSDDSDDNLERAFRLADKNKPTARPVTT